MIELGNKKQSLGIQYPNFEGEDGGYYIPTVSEDGYLEWSPSQPDMPAVEAVNITGPAGIQGKDGEAGESGVYIGTKEPTSANVWINPAGMPSYIMTEDQVKAYIDSALEEVENGTY